MKAKDYTLKALNSIYRSDPWVQQLYNAAGIYADNISDVLDVVFSNYFFDTADLNTVNGLKGKWLLYLYRRKALKNVAK